MSENVVMAAWFVGAIFATSCTSDHFFGIEEETDCMSYSILNKIAQSKEFMEFQKQSFLSTEELCNVDTTQKVFVKYYNGKSIYAIGGEHTIRPYLEAKHKLVESYPEYEKLTIYEKNQIFNLAIMNNKTLRDLAERCAPKDMINRTKAINYETFAVKYVMSKPYDYEMRDTKYGGEWLVGGTYTWYTRENYLTVVSMAIDGTVETGNEHGGYFFNDNSGILNVDPCATPDSMYFYYYKGVDVDYQPVIDFHVHPDHPTNPEQTLQSSPADESSWSEMPWFLHRIYNKNGVFQTYVM